MPDGPPHDDQTPERTDREDAFLALVREGEARLRRICRVYAAGPEDARDLYQDILVQLWRALPGYEGRAQKSTWLYRVALNTALDHERKHAVRRDATLPATHALWPSGPPSPEAPLEAQEASQRLYAAIDRLDGTDKALALLYLEEKTYREMAGVLGLSENHIGVKLHRIKKKLAAWLAEVSA